MFAISTVWNAWRHREAETLVAEIKELGFEKLELGFGMSAEMVGGILNLVKDGQIEVLSLHNYCPAPILAGGEKLSHSVLPLSGRDERERRWAVRQTIRTLETARAVGASAVVLHLGRVPIRAISPRLIFLAENGGLKSRQYQRLKEKLLKKREAKKGSYLEQAARSLESIARSAEALKIKVGIENRYYPEEIPSLDEISVLLKRCASPSVGYWHDVGHAQVRENLGWEEHDEYLKRYSKYLIGIHIHDVTLSQDHKAPLQGEFDFTRIKKYLRKDVIKVLEVHPEATADEIKKSLDYLHRLMQ